MSHPAKFSYLLVILLGIWALAVGCDATPVQAQEVPPTPRPAPKCQQDNKAREIGVRFLFNGRESHYAHVIADPTDARYHRVITDGVLVRERFDAGSVGPLVYHTTGNRFAFVAAKGEQNYILEYPNGGETPFVAERIGAPWNKWVCFGESGRYLFTIARYGTDWQWHLLVREEKPGASFKHLPLYGDPTMFELVRGRDGGRDGVQFGLVNGTMEMEVRSWLK